MAFRIPSTPLVIIKPKTWGFLCTTAHPQGCKANIREQIQVTRTHSVPAGGPKRILVIGASTGYGLAARITAAFGFGAATVGIFHEKPARRKRTASAGWYNAAAFEELAGEAGLKSVSINADAFADATRDCAIDQIRQQLNGPIDLVIYSLASPIRRLPDSGETAHAVVKPINHAFVGKTIDTDTDHIVDVSLDPAANDEIEDTVKVMGGEDWALWIDALSAAGVLADNAKTIAFGYLGPEITWPIYAHGTIGHAKQHLALTAQTLQHRHANLGLDARVAVMKSIVTQASVAIPSIPLYLSLVYKVMKDLGLHETAIEQQNRLFRDFLYADDSKPGALDNHGRFRLDDRELRDDVQQACEALWPNVNDNNLFELTDYAAYKQAFLQLFGFERADIDYDMDVDVEVPFHCINIENK